MNTFGNILRLTTFGESHGPAMGGVIDGFPSRVIIDLAKVQAELDRRRPGASPLTSQRREPDSLQLLSGVMDYDEATGELAALHAGSRQVMTLGTSIGFIIPNKDSRSSDYDELRHIYRPSHADFTFDARYGVRDWRGGGRASGRETVSRVVAGAFARQLLEQKGIAIESRIASLGGALNPDAHTIEEIVTAVRSDGDSVGGTVECRVTGVPAGTGDPVFGKLQQRLASAMMSIGGVKGFEYGMGFKGVEHRGSEVADEFAVAGNGEVATLTNHSGGIQGGISNGMDILFRVAVKPTPTIARPLSTVNDDLKTITLCARGRHDAAIVLRIAPVVEAMAALVILDSILLRSTNSI